MFVYVFLKDASNKDIDVYAEVLKWQKEMQTKSVDEAQIILNSNLEQIARVSLENFISNLFGCKNVYINNKTMVIYVISIVFIK